MHMMFKLRPEHSYAHLEDMQARAIAGVADGSYDGEKLGRHLGWAQSSISSAGIGCSLKDFIEINGANRTGKRSPEEVLRSLVADIEAMQSSREDDGHKGFELYEPGSDGYAYVQWPNLSILLAEAKDVLGA